ncbi:MAG: YfhO family protein [Myxococcaceae bacterium]|nr:YfhO family protein [Myxococcaceae bacterium]
MKIINLRPEFISSTISRLVRLWHAMVLSQWLAPLVLGGIFLILYADVLFGDLVISYRDMLFVYLPTRMHFADRLLNGEFPEWYPFDGLGSSYIGNVVTSLLHPTILLHLILPHPLALNLSVVLMHYLAALGAFFLLRHWHCGRTAAFIGGFAFSLSGYMMSMDGNLPYLCAGAAIPWAVFGIERMSIPLTGAAMALMALSGDPQALYFTSIFLVACAMTRQTPSDTHSLIMNHVNSFPDLIKAFFKDRTRQKAMLVLVAAGAIALLASAAQLLPAIFASEVRDSGAAALHANRIWPLNPLRLFELLSPGFLRLSNGFPPGKIYSQEKFSSFWANSLYISAAVLAQSVIALRFSKQRRICRLLAGLGTLTLMVALGAGHHAPAYEFLQHWLPGFSFLRYPEKTFVFVTFAASMLAGIGAEALLQERRDIIKRTLTRLLLIYMLILFAIFVALPAMEDVLLVLAGPIGDLDEAREEWWRLQSVFQENILIGMLLTVLSFSFVLASLRFDLVRLFLFCGAFIPLCVCAQQFRVYRDGQEFVFLPPKMIRDDGDDRRRRIYVDSKLYKDDSQDLRDGSSVRARIIFLDHGVNALFGIENCIGYLPLTTQGRFFVSKKELLRLSFRQGFSVNFSTKINPDPNVTDLEDALVLVEDKRAGDRIRLVQGIPVGTMEEAIEVANRPHFDSVKVVPVETKDAAYPTEAPKAAKVDVVTYSPEYIDVKSYSETATTLFVADAFADGWRAKIDGEEVPIYPGLIAGRAIPVPAGEHRVELTYKTPGLRVGLVLSAIGWLAIIALAIGSRWRLRKKPNDEVVAA